MKKGLLIVNNFIDKRVLSRFQDLYQLLCEAFSKYGIELVQKTNAEVVCYIDKLDYQEYDFVLFWDKDVLLAKHLENLGLRVFNSSLAIEVCDDKAKTALYLESHQISMPKTIIAPFSFDNYDFNSLSDFSFLDKIINDLGFPLIIKEGKGSFGEQVYLINNKNQMLDVLSKITKNSVIFQEFIDSSFGFDTRILVCGKEFIGAVKRISQTNDFRSNVLQGGIMEPFDPSNEFIEMALKVVDVLGLDFAGVDLMFSKDNKPIFCEVNSNVHFKTFFKTTGINFAESIALYIKKQIY